MGCICAAAAQAAAAQQRGSKGWQVKALRNGAAARRLPQPGKRRVRVWQPGRRSCRKSGGFKRRLCNGKQRAAAQKAAASAGRIFAKKSNGRAAYKQAVAGTLSVPNAAGTCATAAAMVRPWHEMLFLAACNTSYK
ncbi:hypothetical protein NPIL_155931 [Nephila pilipes]|uniref:Uncharacterized protein n=1 Tax=Nephila pilipes TaxID=299642 RepID=A0A8X6T2B8_NEPPI|nr:hypothetical protein NPIL_155931 [Nephila pilipes]